MMRHARGWAVVLAAVMGVLSAAAQVAPDQAERGMKRNEAPAAALKAGHRYVVAIGINHYANWPVLGTAVSDATGFAQLLHDRFGYELPFPAITEKEATRQRIESLVEDDLRGLVKPEDDLVIFFAGHGTTRTDAVGEAVSKTGFLVPYEAHAAGDGERYSDYLKVDELLRTISELPARHILVILDSCHSGLALGSSFSPTRGAERYSQDVERKVSRKVIASAQGDQTAADAGPVANHSLFTGLMMQGLTSGKADSFGQGFVTASQLGAYVQHAVGVSEGAKQTPLFGSFYRDDSGELILPFPKPEAASGSEPSTLEQAEGELFNGNEFKFVELEASDREPHGPVVQEWLRYQRRRLNGDTTETLNELKRLDSELLTMDAKTFRTGELRFLRPRRQAVELLQSAKPDDSLEVRVDAETPGEDNRALSLKHGGAGKLSIDSKFKISLPGRGGDPVWLAGLVILSSTGDAEFLGAESVREFLAHTGTRELFEVHVLVSDQPLADHDVLWDGESASRSRQGVSMPTPKLRQAVITLRFGE